jgi:hypothetical protein
MKHFASVDVAVGSIENPIVVDVGIKVVGNAIAVEVGQDLRHRSRGKGEEKGGTPADEATAQLTERERVDESIHEFCSA